MGVLSYLGNLTILMGVTIDSKGQLIEAGMLEDLFLADQGKPERLLHHINYLVLL